jgi:type II secretory pathway component PulC
VFLVWRSFLGLPEAAPNAVRQGRPAFPEPSAAADLDWTIVQNRAAVVPEKNGKLAARFRLAGTFFEFGTAADSRRMAILDDIGAGFQRIVSENDRIDDVQVVSIFGDRVLLRAGSEEAVLRLRFVAHGAAGATSAGAGVGTPLGAAGRFGGKQIGPNRWVFSREKLMAYYQGLRDEPERLVKLFDSLKPVYGKGRAIQGYYLGIEGEEDFFEAAGMRQGDVVRSVNSLRMTSRRRAEFLIRQFVANRANAFVLDIERNGQAAKLVYELR